MPVLEIRLRFDQFQLESLIISPEMDLFGIPVDHGLLMTVLFVSNRTLMIACAFVLTTLS